MRTCHPVILIKRKFDDDDDDDNDIIERAYIDR